MKRLALAQIAAVLLCSAALAGSRRPPNQAKFKWTVYDRYGNIVTSKTGTKTMRAQRDFKYNGTHRKLYSWRVRNGQLFMDHRYYGNKWLLWRAGKRRFAGRFVGKKEGKKYWTCTMTPVSRQDWLNWKAFFRPGSPRKAQLRKKTKPKTQVKNQTDAHEGKVTIVHANLNNCGQSLNVGYLGVKTTSGKYVRVDLQILNRAKDPLISPTYRLRDQRGRTYSALPMASGYLAGQAGGPISYQPGVSASDVAVFELPSEATPAAIGIRGGLSGKYQWHSFKRSTNTE